MGQAMRCGRTSVHARGWFVRAAQIAVLALFSFAARDTTAQLTACGAIPGGTVWSLADSPVTVTCDLSIADLTIDAGVEVLIDGNHEIVVTGTIRTLGLPMSPVVIKPTPGLVGGWGGFFFQDTVDGSQFRWTTIAGANDSAVHLVRSYPTFDHVSFLDNRAAQGGALRAELLDKDLTLSDCIFEGNDATLAGGAIFCSGPTGPDDGTLIVESCAFFDNQAGTTATSQDTRGGAVAVDGNASLGACTFIENESQAFTSFVAGGRYTRGGAVSASGGLMEIVASVFLANGCRMGAFTQTADASRAHGGAIHVASGELRLTNALIADGFLVVTKNPDLRGAGVYVGDGVASCVNTTIVDNSHAGLYRDGGSVDVLNTILFFNNGGLDQIDDASGTLTVSYSSVQNGFPGTGNTAFDPQLDDSFRILATSPAVDAGDPDPQYFDVIPPGLGGPRNDRGFLGGPLGFLANTPPTAAFFGTPTSGIVPVTVSFDSSLTIGSISTWFWDFGDGATSKEQSPEHTYDTSGNYTVTLTATGLGGQDVEIKSGYVVVFDPPPVADFGVDHTTGDAPLEVAFESLASGIVSTWSWDFGDGGVSNDVNPTHTYTTPGVYTVSLTLTGPGGQDTETKFDYITVTTPPPIADFSATPTSGFKPLVVDFRDLSEGGPVTSWAWDFGDGSQATESFPIKTYDSAGTYTVSLTVSGPGGQDTLTQTDLITVIEPPPVPSFSGSPTSGQVPLDVSFSGEAVGLVTSWSWTFGDGASSTEQSPTHVYEVPGDYTVTLTASGPGGMNTETKVGYIAAVFPPPVVNFSGAPTLGDAPLVVAFDVDVTGEVETLAWDFGDGGSSSSPSPTHTYTTPGVYAVTLTASGPGGQDTAVKAGFVSVLFPAPIADFEAAPTSGFAPLIVDFTETAGGGPVSAWSWDFGDGATSADQNPQHVYGAAGTYTVTLTTVGPDASDTETKTNLVVVENRPLMLGDKVDGTLAAGDVHVFEFEALEDTKLTLTAKRKGKNDIQPALRVFDPNGVEVLTTADTIASEKLAKVPKDKNVLTATGLYRVEVSDVFGTGGRYFMKTKGKFPSKIKADQVLKIGDPLDPPPAFPLNMLTGSSAKKITVQNVKPKGAQEPTIDGTEANLKPGVIVEDPSGAELVLGTTKVSKSGNKVIITKTDFPALGVYEILVDALDGTVGYALIKATIKHPKGKTTYVIP